MSSRKHDSGWDMTWERDGIFVGGFPVDGSPLIPAFYVGGLSSVPEHMLAAAQHTAGAGRPAYVIDVLHADTIIAADKDSRRLVSPWYDMARIACQQTPLEAFLPENPLPFDLTHFTNALRSTANKVAGTGEQYWVGHSWGGAAIELMMIEEAVQRKLAWPNTRPQQIKGAALLNTVAGFADKFMAPEVMALMANPDRSLERLRRDAGDLYGGAFRGERAEELLPYVARKTSPEVSSRQIRTMWAGLAMRCLGLLNLVEQPTLVVGDTDDPIAPLYNQQQLKKLLHNSKVSNLVITQDVGHVGIVTHPHLINPHIVDFFNRVDNLQYTSAAQLDP